MESTRKKLEGECNQLRDTVEDLEGEKRDVEVMLQRANDGIHRCQADLSMEHEARGNLERSCQTLTRRIVELEVRTV